MADYLYGEIEPKAWDFTLDDKGGHPFQLVARSKLDVRIAVSLLKKDMRVLVRKFGSTGSLTDTDEQACKAMGMEKVDSRTYRIRLKLPDNEPTAAGQFIGALMVSMYCDWHTVVPNLTHVAGAASLGDHAMGLKAGTVAMAEEHASAEYSTAMAEKAAHSDSAHAVNPDEMHEDETIEAAGLKSKLPKGIASTTG